jgi:hypothetical protein
VLQVSPESFMLNLNIMNLKNLLKFIGTLFVASHVLGESEVEFKPVLSPDGNSAAYITNIQNIRSDFEVHKSWPAIVFNTKRFMPFVAYATTADYNLIAWSGNSKFALCITGVHTDPEAATIYSDHECLNSCPIKLDEIWKYGESILPWPNASESMPHDSIVEIQPGENNTIYGLYLRTKYPLKVLIPVTFIINHHMGKLPIVTFIYGDTLWLPWNQSLPKLELIKQGFNNISNH